MTPSTWSLRTQIVMISALAVSFILSSTGFYLSYDAGIYPPFRNAYRMHKRELGRPIQQATSDRGYEAWHEHATVLWVESLPGLVIMPIDSDKWIKRDDVKWNLDFAVDDKITKALNRPIPEGKHPPYGGIATLFLQHLDYWINTIGWREEDGEYMPNSIHLQRFEHGWIIGTFRQYLNLPNGRDFVLLDNGKRYPEASGSVSAPKPVEHSKQ